MTGAVVYVSYDGALDPLGASQVVPYLLGLSERGWSITLVSFEKRDRWTRTDAREAMQRRLTAAGIRWRPLRYRPRLHLAGTIVNALAGARAIKAEVRRSGATIVHGRGDVATVMARWAPLPRQTRLLHDVRGFFSDERVDGGSWRRGGAIDRVVRRLERANLARADAAVVLTARAELELRRRRPSIARIEVIPTCADTRTFVPRTPGEEPDFGLVYSGSLGTWYMGPEMIAFARAVAPSIPGRTLVLTRQEADARALGATADWAEVRGVEPADVPAWIRRGRALLFFIRPVASKRASCPTKLAEGLATGLPVVCNRGIGDLDDLVDKENVGVLVEDFTDAAYRDAGRRLGRLLEDPELGARCRRLAESRFGLDVGVAAYDDLYRDLAGRPRRS